MKSCEFSIKIIMEYVEILLIKVLIQQKLMIISDNDNYVELSCCITVLAFAALCLALFTISVVEHLLMHSTPSNWPSQRGRPWLPSANVTRPRPLTVPS